MSLVAAVAALAVAAVMVAMVVVAVSLDSESVFWFVSLVVLCPYL